MTSTASSLATYAFRANGIYDPNLTGVGHQPLGRDIFALIYNHYVVLSARARVRLVPPTAATPYINLFGMLVHEDGTVNATDATALIEQGHCKWKSLDIRAAVSDDCTVSLPFDAKRWFGAKDMEDNISLLGATMGGTPTDIAAFVVFVQPQAIGALTATYYFTIDIEYVVLFTEPIEQAQN